MQFEIYDMSIYEFITVRGKNLEKACVQYVHEKIKNGFDVKNDLTLVSVNQDTTYKVTVKIDLEKIY